MRKIKFVTDSTADIPQSLIDQFEIEIVPLHVLLGGAGLGLEELFA